MFWGNREHVVGHLQERTQLLHQRTRALAALLEGRDLGYRIGILLSSAMGFRVYRRLSFERYSTYSVYKGGGQD